MSLTPLDKNFLSLQFEVRVHQKNASEFQSFFEEIMGKAFKDFQKIRPYGKQGDRGNDGYIPDKGIYYQVYSPKDPGEKEADAAKKFKDNFDSLKAHWDQISTIKEYNLVFNDKYSGVSIELEKARAELKRNNPQIEFKLFLPKHLEEIFLSLEAEELASLGFDIDSRNAVRNAREYLETLENELNRGNAVFVLKAIESIKNIVADQNDEGLQLDYEILECKALQRVEKIKEARERYENIFTRYPKDPRAPLLLAEIYLNLENYEKNLELLKLAEGIDPTNWLLPIEKLFREYRLGNDLDLSKVDEREFPANMREKADYYRIYALFFEQAGNEIKADSFIERSLHFNPEKYSGYDLKLSFQLDRLLLTKRDPNEIQSDLERLLSEIESLRQKFAEWEGLGPRNEIYLNIKKLRIFGTQENYAGLLKTAQETFDLLLQCYFDYAIDQVLMDILHYFAVSAANFSRLLEYLTKTEKPISDSLAKMLILQFLHQNILFSAGKTFFERIERPEFIQFIKDLDEKSDDRILAFIGEDTEFAIGLAVGATSHHELRRKIIETLPNDTKVQKEKLQLLLNYEQGNIDEAFAILRTLDLSKLNYAECRHMLDIAEQKNAWDFGIILLEKLLAYEKDERTITQIQLKLFGANLKLQSFPEVIRIGRQVLENPRALEFVEDHNKEILLTQTVHAQLRRGEYSDATALVTKHSSLLKTFVGKAIAADVYLKNKDAVSALSSVVEGIKILKRPSAEEYGSLFLIFSQIANLIDFHLETEKEIAPESFVKFEDDDRWFFVGQGDELDAIKIPENKRDDLLGKKVTEKVIFENPYTSAKNEREVEMILPIEKYILWQCKNNAQKLSADRLWDKMEMIELPTTEKGIDPMYLIARLEDQEKRGETFFNLYCSENVPLAMLALSEGGFTEAIGRITNEQRGFVRANTGVLQEIEQQNNVAKQLLAGQTFYIDGSSAFVLSETGLIEKIHKFLPNMRIPQSVITLLLDITDKFRFIPGQVGHMRYSEGKIQFSPADSEKSQRIKTNFENSIRLLEEKPEAIEVISSAIKFDVFSEQNVAASLSDACILAQRDHVPVLTEDFLYLQMNALETNKTAPPYCSAFALIRVLYEEGKIDFDEYLNFFGYLSFYRFRFLGISTDDLEKAVFGDSHIKKIRVEELRKFNLPFTLSEEYGVPAGRAFTFIARFLVKLLADDSVLPDVVQRIFVEIISTFPTSKDRKMLAKTLLAVSVQALNTKSLVLGTRVKGKVAVLSESVEIYHSGNLIVP